MDGDPQVRQDVTAARDAYSAVGDVTVHHHHYGTAGLGKGDGQAGNPASAPTKRYRRRWIWITPVITVFVISSAILAVVLFYPGPTASTGQLPRPSTSPPLSFSRSTIVTAMESNGTQDVFAIDAKGQIIHTVAGTSEGGWGPWKSFGLDGAAYAITTAPASSKLLHVMAVMRDGSIQERAETALSQWGAWHSFAPANTPKVRVLALGQDHNGDLEAFAVNSAGQFISCSQQAPGGDWDGWQTVTMPGPVQSVAAMQKLDGYLDVMAVLKDGSVEWEDETQTSWRPWVQFGPPNTATEVAIGQNTDWTEGVFALTANGTISIKYEQISKPGHPWTGWITDFGAACDATSVSAGARSDQIATLAIACKDGTMRYNSEDVPDGSWGAWQAFPPPVGVVAASS